MRTTFAIFIVSFIALASSCVYSPPKEPVDYVNPNIGTIGHLLVATASMVQLPHGMVQIGQNPYPPLADRYLADRISGFSVRALPKYTTKPFSWIMATTGAPRINPNDYASGFDHDFEQVTPYYSWILLEDYDIEENLFAYLKANGMIRYSNDMAYLYGFEDKQGFDSEPNYYGVGSPFKWAKKKGPILSRQRKGQFN